jgi:nitroimidazol reductase NimA-like FMN-containing flavoprotein (pyridoxamine 5'-phosphate oxidase superfamily)
MRPVKKGRIALSSETQTINRLKDFFQTQKLTALATQEPGHPYLSLMAFALTDDLSSLIIATKRETRKYSNMVKTPGVSFLIDNRSNERDQFQNTLAVTGIGKAMEIEEIEKEPLIALFVAKHPELENFVKSRECVLVKIKIDKFIIISQFQEAEELDML